MSPVERRTYALLVSSSRSGRQKYGPILVLLDTDGQGFATDRQTPTILIRTLIDVFRFCVRLEDQLRPLTMAVTTHWNRSERRRRFGSC